MDFVSYLSQLVGSLSGLGAGAIYLSVFALLLACGLGLPLPEDISLLALGILSSSEAIHLEGAVIVGFAGVLIGDSIVFVAGRRVGRRALAWPLFRRFLSPEKIAMAEKKIVESSRLICFVARFLPGLRMPIYFTAGMMGVRLSVFLLLDGLAALLSVPLWIYIGYWFGNNFEEIRNIASRTQWYLLATLAALLLAFVAIHWRRSLLAKRVANVEKGTGLSH